jgi:hypothetical protein
MAQQSARRGRKNQGFPQCLEHALGDLDPARELPYRPAATHIRIRGRTDGSIRLRAKTILKFSLDREGASTEGGVHRWEAVFRCGHPEDWVAPTADLRKVGSIVVGSSQRGRKPQPFHAEPRVTDQLPTEVP